MPWAPILAAIPHLWLALSIGISLLGWDYFDRLSPNARQTFAFMMLAGILATSLGVSLYAASHGNPLWASAWNGYAILIGAFILASLLLLLDPENELFRLGMIVLSFILLGIVYFLRFRRARLEALLMSLVLLVQGPLLLLDNISRLTESVFVIFLGCLAAGIAVITVIAQNWKLSLFLVVIANLLALSIQAYILTFMLVPTNLYPNNSDYTLSLLWNSSLLVLTFYLGTWLFWSAHARLRGKNI